MNYLKNKRLIIVFILAFVLSFLNYGSARAGFFSGLWGKISGIHISLTDSFAKGLRIPQGTKSSGRSGSSKFNIFKKSTPKPKPVSAILCTLSARNESAGSNDPSLKISSGDVVEWKVKSTPSNLDVYWYGTDIDNNGILAGKTPYNLSYNYSDNDIGSYVRFAKLKNVSGRVVCTTNVINAEVVADFVLTPTPTSDSPFIKNSLKTVTSYEWSNVEGGLSKIGPNFKFNDFALTVLSTNDELTTVTVSLSGPEGVLKNPVIVTLGKNQTLLWTASEYFPLDKIKTQISSKMLMRDLNLEEYNFKVSVNSSAPVYILPPTLFGANGVGITADGAIKNSWWGDFTLNVPYAIEENKIYFPYTIHWHNFENWPEGWDTIITLTNKSQKSGLVTMTNKATYNTLFDLNDCSGTTLSNKEVIYRVESGQQKIIRLSDFLGINSSAQSHHSEGSLIITVPDVNSWEASVRVISLPDGTKLCPK